jgi:hypothetical protein
MQNYITSQEFSNNMWHTTFMHVFQGDSQLLVVEGQIDTLIPDFLSTITYV